MEGVSLCGVWCSEMVVTLCRVRCVCIAGVCSIHSQFSTLCACTQCKALFRVLWLSVYYDSFECSGQSLPVVGSILHFHSMKPIPYVTLHGSNITYCHM